MRFVQSLMLLSAMSFATGCVQTKVQTEVKKDCDWAQPILPEEADIDVVSASLATQILTHNKTGAALCNWKPPG